MEDQKQEYQWDMPETEFLLIVTLLMHPLQQMQWLSVVLIVVLALVQSTWMMLAAQAVRRVLLTVLEVLLSTVTEVTQKMLE